MHSLECHFAVYSLPFIASPLGKWTQNNFLISWEWCVVIPMLFLGVILSIEHPVYPLISTLLFDSWYDSCKIWTIFKEIMRYFCQIRNMPYWMSNVRGSAVVPLLISLQLDQNPYCAPPSHWSLTDLTANVVLFGRGWPTFHVMSLQCKYNKVTRGLGTIRVPVRGQLGTVEKEDNGAACGGFETGLHGDRTRAC